MRFLSNLQQKINIAVELYLLDSYGKMVQVAGSYTHADVSGLQDPEESEPVIPLTPILS
jgi:hypothetical protein